MSDDEAKIGDPSAACVLRMAGRAQCSPHVEQPAGEPRDGFR